MSHIEGKSSLIFFENRVLRKIGGPNTVTGHWRKLHENEIQGFVSPTNIGMIKSRILK